MNYGDFSRSKRGGGLDPANRFLDHGNYLAYGLGATACWVLGLPHGLAVLHGKTRRGGLVFDAADLIKDAAILPRAFISAMGGDSETEFRQSCVEGLTPQPQPGFHFRDPGGHCLAGGQARRMNVLLISQCHKNALKQTRRVLDQFAERRGERTWQTAITKQGLDTLRRMLKKSARKNTAVACHWIRGRDHTELMWIVGNAAAFTAWARCPPTPPKGCTAAESENDWHNAPAIRLLAALAALFHDLGKANDTFQAKLKPGNKLPMADPFRHEWVSLRILQALAGGQRITGMAGRAA